MGRPGKVFADELGSCWGLPDPPCIMSSRVRCHVMGPLNIYHKFNAYLDVTMLYIYRHLEYLYEMNKWLYLACYKYWYLRDYFKITFHACTVELHTMVVDTLKSQFIENVHVGASLCQEFCIVLSFSLNVI